MVKAFDPSKFRTQAMDNIAANQERRTKAVATLDKVKERLAAIQTKVDEAQEKVDEFDRSISVSQAYLDRTASLDAEPEDGSGVESAEAFGTPTIGIESDPSDEDVAAAPTGPAFSA